MQVQGNYKLFYYAEFITGILLIFSLHFFGDYSLVGMLLLITGLVLTQKRNHAEREISLSYKISSFERIVIGIAMAIIYFKFPDANWFYWLICLSTISRGIIGFLTYLLNKLSEYYYFIILI